MDVHVLLPLGADHHAAAHRLAEVAALAAGIEPDGSTTRYHISLVVVRDGAVDEIAAAVERIASTIEPFVARAHGFGFFCDGTPEGTSLHVPVVAGRALAELHRSVHAALEQGSAPVAPWTAPDRWSPHITLLEHGLDPVGLGRAVSALAHAHHPRWSIPIDRLVVRGPHGDTTVEPTTTALGGVRASG